MRIIIENFVCPHCHQTAAAVLDLGAGVTCSNCGQALPASVIEPYLETMCSQACTSATAIMARWCPQG